jgi:hypothetical protein
VSAWNTPEHHAEIAASLRKLADIVEANLSLPIPIGIRMYASVGTDLRQIDRFAAVHDAAELLGVPVNISSSGGRDAKLVIGSIEYTVFTSKDDPPVGTSVTRAQDLGAVSA